jgi:hypothetical protein
MQTEPMKRKNKGTMGAKVLIGLTSMAGTFGLWALFADKPVEVVKPMPKTAETNSQNSIQQVIEFPPLPTLAAIRTIDQAPTTGNIPSNPTNLTLRQVSQPTPIPQTVKKPVFEQLTINRPGSSSGPAASSGSSR